MAAIESPVPPYATPNGVAHVNGNGNGNGNGRKKTPRTASEKAKTRREASLMLATLVPDLAGSVVGRLNAQAASRRMFATLNNQRLK